MYICCRHCKYSGHFVHEQGHSCRLHDCFINYNNYESVKRMYECTDCKLSIDRVLELARYMNTISFEIVFDDTFHVMNNIGVVINDKKEWNNGFVKDPIKAYKPNRVENDHIIGYRVLFDGFPVYYCERKEEILFILKGIGIKTE